MDGADLELAPMGDGALRWRRDPDVDPRALLDALRAHPHVIDAIVTEEHACVTFDPAHPPSAPWLARPPASPRTSPAPREHAVHVRYDGPDLTEVAARAQLSIADVIRLHASRSYVVRLIGFLPGFAYLGPLDAALYLPRRGVPRARIDAGSVGIAATYTGIYPCASSGGWNLIGHAADFMAFDRGGARFALGDRVRFEALP